MEKSLTVKNLKNLILKKDGNLTIKIVTENLDGEDYDRGIKTTIFEVKEFRFKISSDRVDLLLGLDSGENYLLLKTMYIYYKSEVVFEHDLREDVLESGRVVDLILTIADD